MSRFPWIHGEIMVRYWRQFRRAVVAASQWGDVPTVAFKGYAPYLGSWGRWV